MTQPYDPNRPDHTRPPSAPPPSGYGQSGPGYGQGAPYGQRPAGFDPTRPLGASRPDPTGVAQFAPPKSRGPLLAGIAVTVVAILIAITAGLRPAGLFGEPSPSPTPTASKSAPQRGLPFTSPDGRVTGRWQVVDHKWTENGLQVKVWIAVDRGTLGHDFVAFANDATDAIYPSSGASDPAFDSAPIPPGQEREGWLFFPTQRTNLTLILMTDLNRQLSALPVPA